MDIYLQYFHVITTFNGLFLSGLILSQKANQYASVVLSLWCLSLSAFAHTPLLLINDVHRLVQHISVATLWLPATFGPFLYLYLDGVIGSRRFQYKTLLHFLPCAFCVVMTAHDTLVGLSDIEGLRVQGFRDSLFRQIAQLTIFVQAGVYVLLSGKLIVNYQKQAENQLSNYNYDVFRYLLFTWLVNALVWCLEIASAVLDGVYILVLSGDVLLLLFLSSITLLHWKQPRYLEIHGLQTEVKNTSTQGAEGIDLSNELDMAIYDEKLFLNSELGLEVLSDHMGVSRHLLSEYLNKTEGKNFHQFINEHRIHHFCEALKQNPDENILDLALRSGFSSKSTFNNAFKRFKGMTPSQFRASL